MSKKLLLADDSITIQKVVGITFAGSEYELTSVGDGDTALEKARAERPDLILADVCMPGKSGYDLAAAVKGDPSLNDVPVLLLTGTFEPFDESKAKESGADGWVAKPFESQALIRKVEDLLARCAEAPPAAPSVRHDDEPAAASERTVSDIWSDLARFDLPAESEEPPQGDAFLPDELDVESQEAALPAAEEDDPWSSFDPEPVSDEDGFAPLDDSLESEPARDPLAGAFEEEDRFGLEGAELPPSDTDDDPWTFSGEEDPHGEEEIVELSESDIVEERDGGAAEGPAVMEDAAAESPFFDEGLLEAAEASSVPDEEEPLDDTWLQDESAPGMAEYPLPQESFAVDDEDDLLEGEFAEFAVDPFDDAAADDADEAFDAQRFAPAAHEPSETKPPAFSTERSSGDDPFQIGADDFLAARPDDSDAPGEPLWDTESLDPEHDVPTGAQAQDAVVQGAPRPPGEGEGVITLSEEEIARIVEKVASEVVGRLAQTVLERIAWEVVPDLAEVMIKDEIRKIREEVQ